MICVHKHSPSQSWIPGFLALLSICGGPLDGSRRRACQFARQADQRVLLGEAGLAAGNNLAGLAADWNERVAVVLEELGRQTRRTGRNESRALAQGREQTIANVLPLREHVSELALWRAPGGLLIHAGRTR